MSGGVRPCRPAPARTAATEEFGTELVVYCERTERMHCLDDRASVIWALCDGSREMGQIVEETAAAFRAAPEAVRSDVEATVDQFHKLGLLL